MLKPVDENGSMCVDVGSYGEPKAPGFNNVKTIRRLEQATKNFNGQVKVAIPKYRITAIALRCSVCYLNISYIQGVFFLFFFIVCGI